MPQEALAFIQQKNLLPTRRWTDVMKGMHDRSFVVAGAAKLELLADLHAAVEKAIGQGTTLEEFRRDWDVAVAQAGWTYRGSRGWRTAVVYQTNLRTAYAAGRLAQMRDPDTLKARPFWLYRHGGSANPREQHLSWNGLVLRADDPWWGSHYPPNGWGCSCMAFSLSDDDVRRRGLSVAASAPDDGTYEVVDRVTGEVHVLPRGVEFGWDYAPGERVLEVLAQRAETTPRTLASQWVREVLGSEYFLRWMREPIGWTPVAVLPEELGAAISARPAVVRLSEETFAKQLREHPELTAAEYRTLPDLVDEGLVVQDGAQTLVFLRRAGRLYKAVVKATASGEGVFLTSFHRLADEAEVARVMRRGRVLRDWPE